MIKSSFSNSYLMSIFDIFSNFEIFIVLFINIFSYNFYFFTSDCCLTIAFNAFDTCSGIAFLNAVTSNLPSLIAHEIVKFVLNFSLIELSSKSKFIVHFDKSMLVTFNIISFVFENSLIHCDH